MSFPAVVTDIRLHSQVGAAARWQMTLDRTEFTPGSAGLLEAVTRTGTRLSIPVTGVLQDAEGVLWHEVDKPLAAGTDVTGTVAPEAG